MQRTRLILVRASLAVLALSLLLLCSCPANAEHPFLDPEYCRVEEFLLGRWEVHNNALDAPLNSVVEIRAADDGHSMWLVTVKESHEANAEAGSGSKVPSHLWVAEFDGQTLMCMHEGNDNSLYAVNSERGAIVLHPLSSKWILAQIEAKHLHPDAVKRHATVEESNRADNSVTLVGKTEDLQPLLHLAAQDPAAFRDDDCLYLVRSAASAS